MRNLAEVLQAELEVVQQLIAACREEQAALVANDLAGIQAATARKGELARQLGDLEQERQQVVMKVPGTTNLSKEAANGDTPNPAQGLQLRERGELPEEKGEASPAGTTPAGRLTPGNLPEIKGGNSPTGSSEALRAALRQAVREFQEINDTNRLLTRQSLAYVQKILSLLVPEGTAPGIMDRVV